MECVRRRKHVWPADINSQVLVWFWGRFSLNFSDDRFSQESFDDYK